MFLCKSFLLFALEKNECKLSPEFLLDAKDGTIAHSVYQSFPFHYRSALNRLVHDRLA